MNEEKEVKLKKYTPQEVMDSFYNGHLREYISATIRLKWAQSYDPDEFVAQSQGPQMGKNQIPATVRHKAKEMIAKEEETIKVNRKFILAVEELEKEFVIDSKPWQKQ